jgi:VanZ family protein
VPSAPSAVSRGIVGHVSTFARTALGPYLAFVGWITLGARTASTRATHSGEAFASTHVVQFLLNAMLFVPVGGLVALGWRLSARRSTVVALAVSAAIELVQLTAGHRTAELRDVVANTAGAAVGAVLTTTVRRLTAARG